MSIATAIVGAARSERLVRTACKLATQIPASGDRTVDADIEALDCKIAKNYGTDAGEAAASIARNKSDGTKKIAEKIPTGVIDNETPLKQAARTAQLRRLVRAIVADVVIDAREPKHLLNT